MLRILAVLAMAASASTPCGSQGTAAMCTTAQGIADTAVKALTSGTSAAWATSCAASCKTSQATYDALSADAKKAVTACSINCGAGGAPAAFGVAAVAAALFLSQ